MLCVKKCNTKGHVILTKKRKQQFRGWLWEAFLRWRYWDQELNDDMGWSSDGQVAISRQREQEVAMTLHFFLVFCLFRATHLAYGGSQARGLNGSYSRRPSRATATGDLSYIHDLHHSSRQCWIFNPLIDTSLLSTIVFLSPTSWSQCIWCLRYMMLFTLSFVNANGIP